MVIPCKKEVSPIGSRRMSLNLLCYSLSRWIGSPALLLHVLLVFCYYVDLSSAQNCSRGSSPLECGLGVTTFSTETGCCELCSTCSGEEMFTASQCNTTHDAVCECNSPTFLVPQSGECSVACELCPVGRCKPDTQECECTRPECHEPQDIYCRDSQCEPSNTVRTFPPSLSSSSSSSSSSATASTTASVIARTEALKCNPGVTTYNRTSRRCDPCTTCTGHEMFVVSECTVFDDTVCDCRSPTFLDASSGPAKCHIVCEDCPRGTCNEDGTACVCENPQCHYPGDIYCREPLRPPCVPVIPQSTTQDSRNASPSPFDQNSLPTWGIGLIAVGIVIGIIIFASCFLCMGLFSMHKNTDPESLQGSEASENGLVGRDSFASAGTNSTYMSSSSMYPYLSNHSMLEILKNSNPQLVHPNNRVSSLQNSPVSIRASPRPGGGGGTVRLAKSADSDKLTAIVF